MSASLFGQVRSIRRNRVQSRRRHLASPNIQNGNERDHCVGDQNFFTGIAHEAPIVCLDSFSDAAVTGQVQLWGAGKGRVERRRPADGPLPPKAPSRRAGTVKNNSAMGLAAEGWQHSCQRQLLVDDGRATRQAILHALGASEDALATEKYNLSPFGNITFSHTIVRDIPSPERYLDVA